MTAAQLRPASEVHSRMVTPLEVPAVSLTQEQHAVRRTGIGGSEIAAIVGLPGFAKPIDVWRSKVDETFRRESTFRLELGNLLEPVVLELYRRRTGHSLARMSTVKHPTLPLVCTPDALAYANEGPPKLVEAKTVLKWMLADWGEDGTDGVPKPYVAQVQHNMHVLRANGIPVVEAMVPVLVSTDEFRTYCVPYAPDVAEALADAATEWWAAYVETRTPPQPDGSPSYSEWLEAAYPMVQREEVVADAEADKWAAVYAKASGLSRNAEAEMRSAQQRLMEAMGNAESMVGSDWRATWRMDKNGKRRWRFRGGES